MPTGGVIEPELRHIVERLSNANSNRAHALTQLKAWAQQDPDKDDGLRKDLKDDAHAAAHSFTS